MDSSCSGKEMISPTRSEKARMMTPFSSETRDEPLNSLIFRLGRRGGGMGLRQGRLLRERPQLLAQNLGRIRGRYPQPNFAAANFQNLHGQLAFRDQDAFANSSCEN